MQATPDGEFYPEKDLDKNYKIPKRKSDEMKSNYSSSSTKRNDQYNKTQTPLASSYYNYPYDPNAASAYYGNYAQYYSQYNAGFRAGSSAYPASSSYTFGVASNSGASSGFNQPSLPPPPPPGTSVEPIQQNICNTLKDIRERPKNNKRNIFQSTVPDITDESLPKDLKALFQPLFCKLCTAQLSSNQTAKMHYSSRNHEKKIKKWLIDYSEKTGEPLHKRAKITNEKQAEDIDKNPAWFHCDVCDLQLTGRLHAESHYMGRNHQKALMGHKAPAGNGYYDDSGKWVRVKAAKPKSFNFENGEDNFGNAFKKEEPQPVTPLFNSALVKVKQPVPPSKFHCDLCNVNTTCQEQLDNHLRGIKHQKKLKHLGLNKFNEQRDLVDHAAGHVPKPSSIIDTAPAFNDKDLNLAVYRTPSGDYYCPSCNITSNSEGQFLQHLKSKNHNKKASQKKSGAN